MDDLGISDSELEVVRMATMSCCQAFTDAKRLIKKPGDEEVAFNIAKEHVESQAKVLALKLPRESLLALMNKMMGKLPSNIQECSSELVAKAILTELIGRHGNILLTLLAQALSELLSDNGEDVEEGQPSMREKAALN